MQTKSLDNENTLLHIHSKALQQTYNALGPSVESEAVNPNIFITTQGQRKKTMK